MSGRTNFVTPDMPTFIFKANLIVCMSLKCLELARALGEVTRGVNFGCHVGEHETNRRQTEDGLAELLALLHVIERLLNQKLARRSLERIEYRASAFNQPDAEAIRR
jgi:hypothetical protein